MDSDSRVWDRIEILERSLFLLEKKVSDWLEQNRHNSESDDAARNKSHALLQNIDAGLHAQQDKLEVSLGELQQRLTSLEKQQELGNRLASMETQLQEKIENELLRVGKTMSHWGKFTETHGATLQKAIEQLEQARNRCREELQELEEQSNDVLRQRELKMAEEILPALDAIEAGIAGGERLAGSSLLNWLGGPTIAFSLEQMRLAHQRLLHWLSLLGVSQIPAEGLCDPKFHRIVASESGKDNHIIRQVNKGYRTAEQVLRHAEVVAGKSEPVK